MAQPGFAVCENIRGAMRANLPLRLTRSAAFAAVCVMLGAGAHWFAGGGGLRPQVLLVGGLVVMTTVAALAGRERSPATVIALLLAAQIFLHQLLGHGDISGSRPYEHDLGVSLGMLVAHATASLITGWWLARGEAAVWAILRRLGGHAMRGLRALLTYLLVDVSETPCPPPVRTGHVEVSPPVHVLRHAVIRRGPPILIVF